MSKSSAVKFDRNTNTFVGMSDEVMHALSSAYPRAIISAELSKMSVWLSSEKGLKRQGNLQFIQNWLQRSEDYKQNNLPYPNIVNVEEGPLADTLKAYLELLWQNREFLLALNSAPSNTQESTTAIYSRSASFQPRTAKKSTKD